MKHNVLKIFAVSTLLVASCTRGSNTWSYRPMELDRLKSNNKTFTVLTFKDVRDSKKDYDDTILGFIPIVNKGKRLSIQPELSWNYSFSSSEYNVPEGNCVRATDSGEYNQFKPAVNLASVFYTELSNQNMFKDVRFACAKSNINSDYYLEGKVLDTSIFTESTTYRLGVFAAIPWIFGASTDKNTINLAMQLQIVNKSNDIIFRKEYRATPQVVVNSFYSWNTLMVYEEMVKEIYTEFQNDIKKLRF